MCVALQSGQWEVVQRRQKWFLAFPILQHGVKKLAPQRALIDSSRE